MSRVWLSDGEQSFALAIALRPALTECLARTAHVMGGTDQVLERMFEVTSEVTPVARIQLRAL
ncbi:MAG: hypothetical protein HKP12_00470 [Gammaproteobacteria bacterium]|nr:hypothetical protein [Gammaproteobacteria bacterium]